MSDGARVGILADRAMLLVLASHGVMAGAERGELDLQELRVLHNLAVELRDGLLALAGTRALTSSGTEETPT